MYIIIIIIIIVVGMLCFVQRMDRGFEVGEISGRITIAGLVFVRVTAPQ